MKTKYFAFVFLLVGFSFGVHAQKIGFIQKAQHRISADLTPIKERWETALVAQNLPVSLVNFEIRSGLDEVEGTTFYVLQGSSRTGSIKVCQMLTNVGGNLSMADKNTALSSVCYTEGSALIYPIIEGNTWKCKSRNESETCEAKILIE